MNSNAIWNLIQDLRQTRGTNLKKHLLGRWKDDEELQKVLLYTYDPFRQYGSPGFTFSYCGLLPFCTDTWTMLDALASGALSGNAAKAAIKTAMKDMTYASGQLLCAILSKSLDIGLAAAGINDVFPDLIPTHPIQLAKPVDWDKVMFPCYISPKLDGLRAVYRKGFFYSRKGHRLEGLTELARQTRLVFGGRTLDGELMVPGVHFNEISGKIRSFNETPNAVYHVFDLPEYMGPFHYRYHALYEMISYNDPYADFKNVRLVQHERVNTRKDAEIVYDQFRKDGYEGAMLKSWDGMYEGKRTWAWQKMKNTDTADCKVIGMFEGGGKYDGLVGGLYVDFNGVRVGVGSGLTDLQRREWADEPELIIGKTVEVAYNEITPAGSLRHPRLLCVRGDM